MKKHSKLIEFKCRIAKAGYEWKTVKNVFTGKQVELVDAKSRMITTKDLPDDAHTRFCELGWELKKKGADKKQLILDNVHEFGSLWDTELYSGEAGSSLAIDTFPQVQNYEKLSTWLYDTRLDLQNGYYKETMERIIDAPYEKKFGFKGYKANPNIALAGVFLKKVRVGRKIEIVYCPPNLISAIDLQFTLNLDFVNYNKICEVCKKPFQSSRSDARFCQDKSTCKVNNLRNKRRKNNGKNNNRK